MRLFWYIPPLVGCLALSSCQSPVSTEGEEHAATPSPPMSRHTLTEELPVVLSGESLAHTTGRVPVVFADGLPGEVMANTPIRLEPKTPVTLEKGTPIEADLSKLSGMQDLFFTLVLDSAICLVLLFLLAFASIKFTRWAKRQLKTPVAPKTPRKSSKSKRKSTPTPKVPPP